MMKKQRQNAQNSRKKPAAGRKQKAAVLYKTPKSLGQSPLAAYRACLADPFSVAAQGARVPDMYCIPTATRHITRKLTLASNASGEADLIVFPSAFLHAFSPRGSIVGGDTWVTQDGTSTANAAVTTTTSAMSNVLANYRIVGYGVKVIGVAAMTTNAGSATLATIPSEGFVNSQASTVGGQASNVNNSNASVQKWLFSLGIPTVSSVVSVSSLPSACTSLETSMVNLSERPISVAPKICSPSAFKFKVVQDAGPGFNITSQTSVASVSAGNSSYLEIGGQETSVIALTGCPASTNMLDVEIIYHLEGAPFIGTATNSIIGQDSSMVVCDPVGWMNVIKDVAAAPTFRAAAIAATNSFFPGLGTMVGRLF